MEYSTPTSPHTHTQVTVSTVMLRVFYALLPGVIAYVYFFGWGVVINIAWALVVALGCEALMLKLRGRPLSPFLSDGSALVTAALLALAIPPLSPWWVTFVGVAFAIIIAKHLYGGLGYNPFNPAMIGYAMLLISFPKEMTTWFPPQVLEAFHLSFGETFWLIFSGELPRGLSIDGITMATPLDVLKTQLGLDKTVSQIHQASPLFGDLGGIGWEWINGGFLLGGLWLIYKRVIAWHIPASLIIALGATALLFYGIDPETYASPAFHIFSGATILGAFFIATDPVTGSTTPLGRILFGAGIGILIYIIRTWGGYPDAVAFSVLLMNMAVPLIDYYTQPPVYGRNED